MLIKISQDLFQRIIKFSIVGGSSTILNYSIFYILHIAIGLHYIFSSSFGYMIGLLGGYFFNKYWTFSKKVNLKSTYLIKYIFAQIGGLILCQISLFLLVNSFKTNTLIANFLSLGIASIFSFLLIDLFVFNPLDDQKRHIQNA